jgi:hypothetical protein
VVEILISVSILATTPLVAVPIHILERAWSAPLGKDKVQENPVSPSEGPQTDRVCQSC